MKIYLDNAATTPMLPEVIELVNKSMQSNFGNPSSTHSFGRTAKSLVETARKNIAKQFNVTPSEIIFTAGGSEADNLILRNAVTQLGVETIISSAIEHHAVLHTIASLKEEFNITSKQVDLTENGGIDYKHLEQLLAQSTTKTLVSLMHINNETGRILDLQKVSDLCQKYKALFHSDTVQGIAHFKIDLQKTPIDFIAASAHKFHGPKGVGFAYFKKGSAINPMLLGGEQERGARAGTENIHSILGMEKAIEIAYSNLEKDTAYIQDLKTYFISKIKKSIPNIQFNGMSEHTTKSSYIILNVLFPKEIKMLLFNLDLKGIAASGGSACQSGSTKGSHVLQAILSEEEVQNTSVRFSFSKLNTKVEIDYVIGVLRELVE
ncbi:MAG TPA: cysteine desulfurase [Lutibacter sp.]|nr:cysteine desulfurase [Lutibacter sp.]